MKLDIRLRAALYTILFLLGIGIISAATIFIIETFGFKVFIGAFFAWCLWTIYEIQLSYLKQKEVLDRMVSEKPSEPLGKTE
jgi:hypothetical protein